MNTTDYSPGSSGNLPAQIGSLPPFGGDETMSSREIADLVEKRHDNVKRTIETLAARGVITLPQIEDASFMDSTGKTQWLKIYRVGKRDSYVIVAQLSPEFTARLVDYWQEHEGQAKRIMSPAEMFLHNAQAMVAIERKQIEQGRALADIGATVARVEKGQTVQKSRPAGSESITHIRPRIGKLLGISAETVDAVMRTVSYSPRVAAMVLNDRVEAEGTTYAVFWQKDVTKCFRQFAGECTQVTATMWTHPQIEGRFKMSPQAVGVPK